MFIIFLYIVGKPNVRNKVKKFHNLAKQYHEHNKINWISCYGKALYLVGKCEVIDLYQSYTSFYTKRYTFIKYIHGGNVYFSIIPNKTGPKPNLEYAYIDDVRQDQFVSILSGMNRNFSGAPESLLEFGDIIRYKYSDQDEIIITSKNQSGSEKSKKMENTKKIKNLVWSS